MTIKPISGIIEQTDAFVFPDTIVQGERFFFFAPDSAYAVLRDGSGRKVIYTGTVADGGVHFKIYNHDGSLRKIAYARHIPLAHNYYFDTMHPHPDSVVIFHDNGAVRTIGFVEYEAGHYQFASFPSWTVKKGFDYKGVLTYKLIANVPGGIGGLGNFTSKRFHPNGKLKEKWVQGTFGGFGVGFESMEWDSLGRKVSMHQSDFSFPEWAWSGRDLFQVTTFTRFHPNGNIKHIVRTKSFAESDVCPCGEWLFFDEKGEIIRREQHTPCDNFELDCDFEEANLLLFPDGIFVF